MSSTATAVFLAFLLPLLLLHLQPLSFFVAAAISSAISAKTENENAYFILPFEIRTKSRYYTIIEALSECVSEFERARLISLSHTHSRSYHTQTRVRLLFFHGFHVHQKLERERERDNNRSSSPVVGLHIFHQYHHQHKSQSHALKERTIN